jgi:spore germination protein GerM
MIHPNMATMLSFFTTDVTRTALADAMKEAPSGSLGKVLSENAGLKSLYLGQDGMVYADFSKELVTEMNAGSGYEAMLLQCITNTLGGYYGTDKVYITVEGEPYSSGHIYMNPGQPFVVDLTSSVELK